MEEGETCKVQTIMLAIVGWGPCLSLCMQCNQEVQKQLFGRVAVNYVKLLCELIEERWRDVFFKVRSEQDIWHFLLLILDMQRSIWKSGRVYVSVALTICSTLICSLHACRHILM